MTFCLGEHMNREFKRQGKPTLDELWKNKEFISFCAKAFKDKRFILNEIRTDMNQNNHSFSLACLLIADYMQN